MEKRKKILILYASYGEGHRQVTSALEKDFAKKGVETVSIDLYREAYPLIDAIARYIYKKSFSHGKWLYGLSYSLAKHAEQRTLNLRPFFAFGIRKLKQIVRNEAPDAVVSTFPFLALPELWRQQGLHAPIYTVITDFSLHDFWIHPMIDKYFVATDELKETLVRKGYRPEHIVVSGIPIREIFQSHPVVEWNDQTLGDGPTKKNILIMAGTISNPSEVKELANRLLASNQIGVLLVCGKNEKLKHDMDGEFGGNERVRVFGYVDKMDELMAGSFCIVTKAGGITLTEAISMTLPIIVYRPVPGQESENAEFMVNKGAAILVKQTKGLADEIFRLSADPLKVISMKSSLQKLAKKYASQSIVSVIMQELQYPPMSISKKQLVGGVLLEN